ncbi:MAG: hypothetical protein ACTSSF_03620 [Candidatus Heimdallarchaeaceae archaeon]
MELKQRKGVRRSIEKRETVRGNYLLKKQKSGGPTGNFIKLPRKKHTFEPGAFTYRLVLEDYL